MKLPGERDLSPGEPEVRLRQLGGPVTLESFRLIHTDELSWHRDLPTVFTFVLLRRSQARRINAGPSKLLFEAARETLKTFEPSLHRMYAKRGWLSYLPDELADELAKQLVDEVRSDTSIKDEVVKWLNSMRHGVATDDAFAFMPQSTRLFRQNEAIEETFSRYVDHYEYVKSSDVLSSILRQCRFIVCCARVHDAVFGTSILQPTRA